MLVHSILGCFFYGIFTVKVLAVRMHGLPGPMLPVVGGLVCHGADGGGGTGPQLAGGAAKQRFPKVNDQIAFVTDGSGAMPAFGQRLSPAEIREVVAYTRTL